MRKRLESRPWISRTCKAGTATCIIQIWLYLTGLCSRETIHSIKLILYKGKVWYFISKFVSYLQLTATVVWQDMQQKIPSIPFPEEQCKGQRELQPALDNNKSWIHWSHSMQAEKYLFIFLKSFCVALLYLVNSCTGRMIPKPISSTPISTPIISELQATFGKKKITRTQNPQLKYLFW